MAMEPVTVQAFVWPPAGDRAEPPKPLSLAMLETLARVSLLAHGDHFSVESHPLEYATVCMGGAVFDDSKREYYVHLARGPHRVALRITDEDLDADDGAIETSLRLGLERLAASVERGTEPEEPEVELLDDAVVVTHAMPSGGCLVVVHHGTELHPSTGASFGRT